jgi:anti-anti-sigma factor
VVDLVIDSTLAGADAEIVIGGEFDALSGERVAAIALVYLDKPDVERLVVDLRAVSFLDSSGITVLVMLLQAARKAGKQLILRRPGPPAAKVLQIVGLDTVFTIED